MAGLLARKVTPEDRPLLRVAGTQLIDQLKQSQAKSWYKHIDVPTAVEFIMDHDNAYIVDNAYLVVYDVFTPWYAKEGTVILNEVIVLKLIGTGHFSAVIEFLEQKAAEAGAVLTGVGTALALDNTALAEKYARYGYRVETLVLTKEP